MRIFMRHVLIILFIFMLAVSVGCRNESPAFNVNEVVSDLGAFSGSLDVVGITYAYSSSDSTIMGIMDKSELKCASPTCSKVLLPVKIGDIRPEVGDEVKVSGSMVKESWGYLFKADKVQILAKNTLGGN